MLLLFRPTIVALENCVYRLSNNPMLTFKINTFGKVAAVNLSSEILDAQSFPFSRKLTSATASTAGSSSGGKNGGDKSVIIASGTRGPYKGFIKFHGSNLTLQYSHYDCRWGH